MQRDATGSGFIRFGADMVKTTIENSKYAASLLLIEGNYFLTGPTVVDKSNVEQVAKLVKAGYR